MGLLIQRLGAIDGQGDFFFFNRWCESLSRRAHFPVEVNMV